MIENIVDKLVKNIIHKDLSKFKYKTNKKLLNLIY